MRPVLVEIPSKFLFFLALGLAVVSFVRDALERKKNPDQPRSSTPLYMLVGAVLLMVLRGESWVPDGETFRRPWLPVPIFSYGVMLGTSMVIGWFLVMRLAKQDGIPQEQAGAMYMWIAIWSIVGARLLYVIVQFREFDSPLEIFMLHRGGLVAYGGMIAGFLTGWYNCRRRKIHLLHFADVSAPSVILGTAITRVGCLLFGCDYGKRTDLPWAIHFPRESPAWKDHVHNLGLARDATESFAIHPTQVYEMLAGLFLFGLIMLMRRIRKFSGQPFLVWVIGYGILRPIIEIFRDDDQRGSVGPFSTSQFIGIMATVLGSALMIVLIRRYRRDPESLRLWTRPIPAPVTEAAVEGKSEGKSSQRGGAAARRRKAR